MSEQQDPFSYCQAELKRNDPVLHFTALTAPVQHRSAIITLYAFLTELERIPNQVSEPTIGEIRLKWWSETLASDPQSVEIGCGQPNIGPLASALTQIIRQYKLPPELFQQLIDARIFDLYNDPMPDMQVYETYAGETQALPLILAAQILNEGVLPENIADLCGHSGMAIALGKHLANWPEAASHQKLFLPFDIFTRHMVSKTEVFKRETSSGIELAVRDLCQLAQEHHFKAESHFRALKGEGRSNLAPAFMGIALVPRQIEMRRRKPTASIRLANWRSYWQIWRFAESS